MGKHQTADSTELEDGRRHIVVTLTVPRIGGPGTSPFDLLIHVEDQRVAGFRSEVVVEASPEQLREAAALFIRLADAKENAPKPGSNR